jgi:heme/copper-type cytochrome/quinol oxidase subunit 2
LNGLELDYDSILIKNNELLKGDLRLLEVDKPVVIKADTRTRFLVTSADVLHRFAVPSLGVKVDAIPGRLNQQVTKPLFYGKYYGQCSEICGANHSYMPISLEVIKW